MSELKPCPFCGGEATMQAPNMHRMTCITCKECGMSSGYGTPDEATAAWNRRAQPANEPLTLRFGIGDIGVSTCAPEDSAASNELLLWNPHKRQEIGEPIAVADGTTTDDVDVFARLIFGNAASAQVVADAVNRIIDALGDNEPLTLAELREMDGEPVWVKEITPEPIDGDYWGLVDVDIICVSGYGVGAVISTATDSVSRFAETPFSDYGKTWLAYRRKPEPEGRAEK